MQRNILGLSLIEILASLLILSIGLLALLKMEITVIQQDHDSYYYSLALTQAQSLQELFLIKSDHAVINLWNQFNQDLLPQGEGYLQGEGLIISWEFHGKRQFKFPLNHLDLVSAK